MEGNSDDLLAKVRLRFRVLDADQMVLSDRLVNYREATEAADDQSTVAVAALARGEAVTLLVTDPDDGDAVVWRAVWLP